MILISLFPQSWEFPVGVFDTFLLALFEKYAELLKKRFSDDFQEVRNDITLLRSPNRISQIQQIVSTDDYMPMPIQNLEEFDKVINVSWYSPEKPRNEQR